MENNLVLEKSDLQDFINLYNDLEKLSVKNSDYELKIPWGSIKETHHHLELMIALRFNTVDINSNFNYLIILK